MGFAAPLSPVPPALISATELTIDAAEKIICMPEIVISATPETNGIAEIVVSAMEMVIAAKEIVI